MKNVEIWVEGFKNGNVRAQAVLLATIEAADFTGACRKHVKQNEQFGKYYDRRLHTFWGCKIFATEDKARNKFG